MAWTDGDFKLFATGLAIGGQWNLGEVKAGDVVECWNDEGVYDYFYMKFKKAVKEFSFGQFSNTVKVYSVTNDKYLVVTATERMSGTQFKVSCDISGETSGIIVIGLPTAYLQYESGSSVPKFISAFYASGLEKIYNIAYAWDSVMLISGEYGIAENLNIYIFATNSIVAEEDIVLSNALLGVEESVYIGYYSDGS